MHSEERFEKFYADIVKNDLDKIKHSEKEFIKEQKIFILSFILACVLGSAVIMLLDMSFTVHNGVTVLVEIIAFFSTWYWVFNICIKKNKVEVTKEKYEREFKQIIIRKMIKFFNTNLEYFPEKGIRKEDYMEADFENFDTYMAEDLIIGNINNNCILSMSEVVAEKVQKNLQGKTIYINAFNGVFADIEIPKHIETVIYIKKDEKDKTILEKVLNKTVNMMAYGTLNKLIIKGVSNSLDIELDSKEFEKKFDVYTSNEIVAMQFLTSDIMQILVDFYNKTNSCYEICIKNNHIYIRFELMHLVKSISLDKETLYKYYNVFDFIIEMTNKLVNIIDERNYIN